jgi:L-aspartate oxidase
MKPVIIGAGLAGLTVALSLAPMPVIVLSSKKLGGDSSSAWAQGGIAASVGVDDTADLHAQDTVKVGAGLCDADVVQLVTADATSAIEKLINAGAVFDRNVAGQLALGLEAAHSRRRIVHAGDATGAAIMKALVAAVRATPSIDVMEDASARDVSADDNGVSGVRIDCAGKLTFIETDKVVLATGGAGALWQHTTNPLGSWGQGLALAARAGAVLGDLEFMQFHPTAIDIGRDPLPLASEALRGEGAVLVDENHNPFVDSLQPRDVVARAIWNHIAKGHQVFLDARPIQDFARHFPHINALCLSAGIDPTVKPIPVRPAAHYHMGGVKTDAQGRTNIKGLWACGEVANTGLHGANRLASNSLLEAATFGRKVADNILGVSQRKWIRNSSTPARPVAQSSVAYRDTDKIRAIMTQQVGGLRNQVKLMAAISRLEPMAATSDMALVGLMIATAALRRNESRGAHSRTDYPVTAQTPYRSTLTLSDVVLYDEMDQRRAV